MDNESQWGDFAPHIASVEAKIESLSDIDVCLLFLRAKDTFVFRDVFRSWVKMYKEEIGNDPEFHLVFVADDLGGDDETKKRKLRFFKSMREDGMYRKYVKSITIKGERSIVDLEPNVFSSDVRFEEIAPDQT